MICNSGAHLLLADPLKAQIPVLAEWLPVLWLLKEFHDSEHHPNDDDQAQPIKS
jgi:hypothetical protein